MGRRVDRRGHEVKVLRPAVCYLAGGSPTLVPRLADDHRAAGTGWLVLSDDSAPLGEPATRSRIRHEEHPPFLRGHRSRRNAPCGCRRLRLRPYACTHDTHGLGRDSHRHGRRAALGYWGELDGRRRAARRDRHRHGGTRVPVRRCGRGRSPEQWRHRGGGSGRLRTA